MEPAVGDDNPRKRAASSPSVSDSLAEAQQDAKRPRIVIPAESFASVREALAAYDAMTDTERQAYSPDVHTMLPFVRRFIAVLDGGADGLMAFRQCLVERVFPTISRGPSGSQLISTLAVPLAVGALLLGDADFVEMLLAAGLDARSRALLPSPPREISLLGVGVIFRQPEAMKRLLAHGASFADDEGDYRPIECALIDESPDMLKFVLENGGNPNLVWQTAASRAHTPLTYVADMRDKVAHLRVLLLYGADPMFFDADGLVSPLLSAIAESNLEAVRLLVEAGADLAVSHGEEYPLECALRHKDMECVRLLFALGAQANMPKAGDYAPLWVAASTGDHRLLTYFLDQGADLQQQYPLTVFGHWESPVETLELLLRRGCPPDPPDNVTLRESPLVYAARRGQADQVKLLLQYGADVHARAETERTALHRAAKRSADCVEALLKAEATLDAVDEKGRTALHYAAKEGAIEAVEVLLEWGARRMRDKRQHTPLDLAAENCVARLEEAQKHKLL